MNKKTIKMGKYMFVNVPIIEENGEEFISPETFQRMALLIDKMDELEITSLDFETEEFE